MSSSSAHAAGAAAVQSLSDETADATMAFDFDDFADGLSSDSSATSTTEEARLKLTATQSVLTSVRQTRKETKPKLQTLRTPPIDIEADAGNLQDGLVFVAGRPSHLNDIEVVLTSRPDFDRGAYAKVACDDVDKVLARLEGAAGNNWYEVVFEDGRVDQITYDHLLSLPSGLQALYRFQGSDETAREEVMPVLVRKRPRIVLKSDSSEASFEDDVDRDDELHSKARSTLRDGSRRITRQWPQVDGRLQSETRSGSRLSSESGGATTGPANTYTTRRLRRRHRPIPIDDMDELQDDRDVYEDDSDENFDFVQSDLQPMKQGAKRRKRRGQLHAARTAKRGRLYRESSIEFEDLRRSSRQNKNVKSMKESFGDDEAYQEGDSPAVPKVVSVREVFQPAKADFREVHSLVCHTCGGGAKAPNKGMLLHCQGCSLSYHKFCLGIRSAREHQVTKVGLEQFVLQCRICVGIYRKKEPHAPRYDVCQSCHESGEACAPFSSKRTPKQEEKLRLQNGGEDPITSVSPTLIDNPAKVLFRCMACRRAYHFEHLPSLVPASVQPSRADLLDQYTEQWKCRECLAQKDKIQAIMAWRPTESERYKGATLTDLDEDVKEYLVKWEGKSHAHCAWVPGAWAWGVSHSSMRTAWTRRQSGENLLPKFDSKDAIPEEYLMADVVLSVEYKSRPRPTSEAAELASISDVEKARMKFIGLGYEDVVWDAPPSQDAPVLWAAFEAAFREYVHGRYFQVESPQTMKERVAAFRSLNFKKHVNLTAQPRDLQRGQLMEYQLEGLNWLLFKFHHGENAVLADEMGLGKTVQVIALILSLVRDRPKVWPFLIVVPNSTCPNWRREIKFWAPSLRVVTYHGGKLPQRLAYQYELFPNESKQMKAHIVVMSYDSAQDDSTRLLFKGVPWAGLIVDEGQRLKNDQNLLYGALRAMRIPFRVLLTGTPLQNNKRELFNLLQFVDSSQNAAQLDEEYKEITAENLGEVHDMIRPYFLRRTKAGVLKFLPPMAHIIVPVTMTVLQERLCKSIMTKNPDLIRAILSDGKLRVRERGSLNNILMQLRKCLCHPFMYSDAIEDKSVGPGLMHRNLTEASSKLILLNIMLPKLRERGHRVLIFSQFLSQLDIIEDFLAGLELAFERLDGTITSLEKQKRIDRFNEPGSSVFAFLLSTRAGGVGINLASADTVIILDPDFNPHQDLQAISRAHRIGQQKKVLCFQLMTKNSAEEKIMQIGRKKLALDHAVIESMDLEQATEGDLESILKYGAEVLFSDNQKDTVIYDSTSVDKLLDRSQVESNAAGPSDSQDTPFAFARVWESDAGDVVPDADLAVADDLTEAARTSVWESILKEREEHARREALQNKEVLGRGGRRRQAVRYSGPSYGFDEAGVDARGSDTEVDGDFLDPEAGRSSDDSAAAVEEDVDEEVLRPDIRNTEEKPQKARKQRKQAEDPVGNGHAVRQRHDDSLIQQPNRTAASIAKGLREGGPEGQEQVKRKRGRPRKQLVDLPQQPPRQPKPERLRGQAKVAQLPRQSRPVGATPQQQSYFSGSPHWPGAGLPAIPHTTMSGGAVSLPMVPMAVFNTQSQPYPFPMSAVAYRRPAMPANANPVLFSTSPVPVPIPGTPARTSGAPSVLASNISSSTASSSRQVRQPALDPAVPCLKCGSTHAVNQPCLTVPTCPVCDTRHTSSQKCPDPHRVIDIRARLDRLKKLSREGQDVEAQKEALQQMLREYVDQRGQQH